MCSIVTYLRDLRVSHSLNRIMKQGRSLIYVTSANLPNDRAHGIQIAHTCSALATEGVEVTLCIPKRWGVSEEEVRHYYTLDRSVPIRRVRVIDISSVVPGYLSFFVRSVSFSVGALWYALTHMKGEDVVYARGEMVLPLALGAWRYRLCWETHSKPATVWLYRFVLKAVQRVVTLTRYYADELVSVFGVPRDRIVVAPDAVDLEPFARAYDSSLMRRTFGIPDGRTVLMYTGSDQSWKGVDVLKEAVRHLPPHYLLVLVGRIRDDTNGDRRFFYAGPQPHHDIPRWLAAADYLMLSGNANDALSARYTSPMKLFEYMAAGRPIIAFDVPAFREVLDATSALFVPAQDPASIARAIVTVDPGAACRCAATAQRMVQRYTWVARAERIGAHLWG